MRQKAFYLSAEQVRPLANGLGGCYATDRIVVDGQKVGYCYRETAGAVHDSGWRFFAGDESQEYIDDPGNFGLYDVNTIANYDPEIIPLLDSPAGSAYERNASGMFTAVFFAKPGEA